MLVTCDTSHLSIGPCSLVGRLSSEEITSRQQSSTARWSSSRDCAENTGHGVRSAFFCAAMFWRCDVILVSVLILIWWCTKLFQYCTRFHLGETATSKACVVTLYKISIIKRKTKHVNQLKKKKKARHASEKNPLCSNNFRTLNVR